MRSSKVAQSIYTAQAISHDIKNLQNRVNSVIYKIEDLKYRYPHLKRGTKKLELFEIRKKEPETSNKAFDLLHNFGN